MPSSSSSSSSPAAASAWREACRNSCSLRRVAGGCPVVRGWPCYTTTTPAHPGPPGIAALLQSSQCSAPAAHDCSSLGPPVGGAQVLQVDAGAHNLHKRLAARHHAQVKQQVGELEGGEEGAARARARLDGARRGPCCAPCRSAMVCPQDSWRPQVRSTLPLIAAPTSAPTARAARTWARMKGRRLGVSWGPAYSQAGLGSCHSRGCASSVTCGSPEHGDTGH